MTLLALPATLVVKPALLLPMSVCIYIHVPVVARTNSCKNVVLRGCGRLRSSISYFLATRSLQMNVEAANDVHPKY